MRFSSSILSLLSIWSYFGITVDGATCNEDDHHPENGGYFIEGINGHGKTSDPTTPNRKITNSTWAPGIEYPDGSVVYCTGRFCSETCRNDGCPTLVQGHTCSMIRFCYEADSGSDVWLLPNEKALSTCDFSAATQVCTAEEGSDDDCCNFMIEADDDLGVYFFASQEGCTEGQKAAVEINDFADVGDACHNMGLTSSRIQKCTCNFEDSDNEMSTLSEPCHSQFIEGCMYHSPDLTDDDGCCATESCVGKHKDFSHPIGKKLEEDRKLLCNDDIPGLCRHTLNSANDDCCSNTCSECGTDKDPWFVWDTCTGGNATTNVGSCGIKSRYTGEMNYCDFSKCTDDQTWHVGKDLFTNWITTVDPTITVPPEPTVAPIATGPADTYQQTCELPEFEWAAYGTRLTGRMYTRRAALLGDSLFAAGYLKSTNAPNKENFVETDEDFGVTGPYTIENPTGGEAVSITSDLVSYTTEHGSFAQYEVGVVKIDAASGEPRDVYVYHGEGQDETCGLAAKEISNGNKVLAVSGHFVGSLTANHADGTNTTIYNSNAEGTANFVLHPNAIKNGQDDGFVISADAETGEANWIIPYPTSTKDAQTVGVDLDSDGNIYGSGYSCNEDSEGAVSCDGFVAMFAAANGAVVWEKKYTDLGAAMWIVYDATDDALYVTGTTSYKGDGSDSKIHQSCIHDVCAVTMRLSAINGDMDWIRVVQGSPRWNFFDQTGDIRLASDLDGPYIYVALDDAGENGAVTLDEGTPYAACRDANGVLTPEYEIIQSSVMTAADCPNGSTFISRSDEAAYGASAASTGAQCGAGHEGVDACIMKYHKYTGLPIWGSDIHPVASIVPTADGKSLVAVGFYWRGNTNGMGYNFDTVTLPNYNGVEGAYNAKLDTVTGKGIYVMHSGGVGKMRPYDAVASPDGAVFMVGYTQSAVINWGGTLQTKIIEEGIDQNDDAGTAFQMGKVSSNTKEYQFFAVKLGSSEKMLSCVESCSLEGGVADPVVMAGHCLIDNVCYSKGDSAELFGRPCLACNPEESQTEWSYADEVGDTTCFIEDVCYDLGDYYNFRVSRRENYDSNCQWCDPTVDAFDWSVKIGYILNGTAEPPNDCQRPLFEGVCFSGKNQVEVEDNRAFINMESLQIGDSVRVGGGEFAKVYSFGHRNTDVAVNYLQIKTNELKYPLEISDIHMIFVKIGDVTKSVVASSIKIGDILLTGNGGTATVSHVKNVQRIGAYAPFTTSGDIIVNGILASNYVSLLDEVDVLPVSMQWIAHTFKAPHRMLCSLNFSICHNETYNINGLSTWIVAPFYGGKWLAKQNIVAKTLGLSILISFLFIVSMIETIVFSPVLLLSIITFGFVARKMVNEQKQ